ncbi:MAG TPA: hypothetical protein VK509_03965, partial [Polyangiales bacterium]|nr:hypothetical protein [Polyangiales bacterium]
EGESGALDPGQPPRAAEVGRPETSRAAAARAVLWQRLAPWLAWLALGLVLELPALGLRGALRPTGDVLVLATGLLLAARLPRGRRQALAACALLAGLLWLYRVHRVVFQQAFGDEPLLYDQLYMARHLFVLFGDVWNAWVAAALVALVAVLWAIARAVRVLARVALRLAEPERWRTTARVLMAAWLLCIAGSVLPFGVKASRRWVRWATPALARNVARSIGMYERVERDIARSPYRRYGSLALTRRPDIYLVMVESYGRVMIEHPKMQAAWRAQSAHMERTLTAAGWTAVSAFSEAPVLGGRSWLAEASVLMGARVRYEAVFRQLVAQIERVPTLHSLLRAQGYHRVLLAPADRVRPGVEEADYYRYDRSVRFDDLRYRGPHVGWGIVPDQYSLGFFAKHVLPHVPQPRFVDFHMVSSHAPWRELPQLVDDFETLNRARGAAFVERDATQVHRRLERYLHGKRFTYMGDLSDEVALRYRDAILYDLTVLERHLATLEDDALVILLGDHQPPFISTETASFDTPIHVLARDPELLRELSAHGFTPGLHLLPGQPAAVRHQGLFSLLARSLARSSALPEERWPKYRAKGARFGD